VLAIDIGGTKMACALVDTAGELLGSRRITTPRTLDAEALFAPLEHACRSLLEASPAEVTAIGVGCGGPMRYPEGVVSPLNIPGWRDFPLRDRLSAAFSLPCRVDNDAKALAIGERWRGAGHGSDNMLGMVVSTGVGGGVILDGRLLHGFGGNAGHIGHIVVWPDGPLCGCGTRGCVEGVASGSGLVRRLATALAEGAPTTSLTRAATAEDIATAARAGDMLAQELYRTAGEAVGRGIASAAALLDLELVVIGGSIALHAWDLLGPPLEAELRASAHLDFTRDLKLVHAELGDQAGLFGAAQLALALL
jgi:glucokinase